MKTLSCRFFPVTLALGGFCGVFLQSAQAGESTSGSANTDNPYCFAIDVGAAHYRNPFDPAEIAVTATVTAPSGTRRTVPGFWLRYDPPEKGAAPATGEGWRVCFAPTEMGQYHMAISVKDANGERELKEKTIDVTEEARRSFIHQQAGKNYFAFDSGDPFFPIGHNAGWFLKDTVRSYETHFQKMHAAGENCTRIWLADWTLGPENRWHDPAGRYDQARMWQLDQIMDAADRNGIYVMLTLLAACDFADHWEDNPYNSKCGGPCTTADDFFTNPEAKALFARRLQYLVARYSHHTHLFAWELWNEVDGIGNTHYQSQNVAAWHKEMAAYLKKIDPYGHPVTTSFAWRQRDDGIWKLPEIDFTQTHLYSAPEEYGSIHMPSRIGQFGFPKAQAFAKPTLVGEFGAHPREGWKLAEDDGVCLHNGLWAGTMSGAAGAPLYWFWDYVAKANLWNHFTALSAFVKGVDWNREAFEPAKLSASKPELWCEGLRGKDICLLWVQNKNNTFFNHRDKVAVDPISEATLALVLPGKKYSVERWNTYEGKCVETTVVATKDGQLKIPLPALDTDVAYKIKGLQP